MTQYFVNPFIDGNGGCGSANCPWNGFAEIDWSVFVVGDSLVLACFGDYREALVILVSDVIVEGRNATIDGEGIRAAVAIEGRQRITLRNIHSVNHVNSGFKVSGNCEDIMLEGLSSEGCPRGANVLNQGTEVISGINVRNCRFFDCSDAGIRIAHSDGGDISSVIVEGNRAEGCGMGVDIYSRFGGPFMSGSIQDVRVIGNVAENCGVAGINISKNVSSFVVEHNTVKNVTGTAAASGIHCGGVTPGESPRNGLIRANVVDGVVLHTTDGAGILIDDNCSAVIAEENVCSNCGEVGVKIHNCDLAVIRLNCGKGSGQSGVKTPGATNYVIENNALEA